jgi:hypothetical protein
VKRRKLFNKKARRPGARGFQHGTVAFPPGSLARLG